MVADTTLNDVLLFLSPLRKSGFLVRKQDYIVETEIGCFRVAYSPSTHCTALFYARHPDDLAAVTDKTGPAGIAHKDRVILLTVFKVNHSRDAKWDQNDKRQQFDLSWLHRKVASATYSLPRIQMREANLHRTGEDVFSSVFVAYEKHPSARVSGEFSINIITKLDDNYRLAPVPEPVIDQAIPSPTNPFGRLFGMLAGRLNNAGLATSFPLRSLDSKTGDFHTSFKTQTLRDVAIADFGLRLDQIWRGFDPVRWQEELLFPVYRSSDSAMAKPIADFKRAREEGTENLIRYLGVLGLHFAQDGVLSLLSGNAIDKAGEFAKKESLGKIPAEWRPMIAKHARRLVATDSLLHKTMLHPDPEKFGDFRWLNPAEHLCSFSRTEAMVDVNPVRSFGFWAKSLFLAPYANSFEYRGDGYKLLKLNQLEEIRLIQSQASNGMMLHYVPETGKLYAYYNEPDYLVTKRNLPGDAANFLHAGQVLQFDLKGGNDEQIIRIPYQQFVQEIRQATNAPSREFPAANTPTADVTNKLPVPKAEIVAPSPQLSATPLLP